MAQKGPARLRVVPADQLIAPNSTQQYTAILSFFSGQYQNGGERVLGSQVTWSSSDQSVATVDPTTGLVSSGPSTGTTMITAHSGPFTISVPLTVSTATLSSLTVTPGTPSLPLGLTQQFTATGNYSDSTQHDLTSSATWSSTANSVATVEAGGLAVSHKQGSATIQASFASTNGSASLTVVAPALELIDLSPVNPQVVFPDGLQLLATGIYSDGSTQNVTSVATWSSTNTGVVTVASGTVTSHAPGSATILATVGAISASTMLVVNEPPAVATFALPEGTASRSYSAALQGIGGIAPYTWNIVSGSLPQGLKLNADGTITGIPGAVGFANVTVQLADSEAIPKMANQTYTIGVDSGVVSGAVNSGLHAVANSQITLFQAGTGGYGSSATALASTTSAADGSFTISIPQRAGVLYLVASGGNAGFGFNAALKMMAVLGSPFARIPSSVVVNEVTTVASVWALQQFFDAEGQNIGAPSTNAAGINNAASMVSGKYLVDPATGLTPSPAPNGLTTPTSTLYTLADVIAPCVNSSGPNSTSCQQLFTQDTPPSTGFPPTDTLEAVLFMAQNPANNVSSLFALAVPNSPFSPSASSVPQNENHSPMWTLVLLYAPPNAAISIPRSVTIDGNGSLWISNPGNNAVVEFPAGNYLLGARNLSPPAAGLNYPEQITVDSNNNVWVGNANAITVTELPLGNYFNGATTYTGFNGSNVQLGSVNGDGRGNALVLYGAVGTPPMPWNMAVMPSQTTYTLAFNNGALAQIDGSENIWVIHSFTALTEVLDLAGPNSGQEQSFGPFFGSGYSETGLALDGLGNVWVAGFCCSNNPFTASQIAVLVPSTGRFTNYANFGAPLSVDGGNNIWSGYSKLPLGNYVGGAVDYAPAQTFLPRYVSAIDPSGSVWFVDFNDNKVAQVVGAAVPVMTPSAACIALGKTICLP